MARSAQVDDLFRRPLAMASRRDIDHSPDMARPVINSPRVIHRVMDRGRATARRRATVRRRCPTARPAARPRRRVSAAAA
ncbi:hypothetical protein GCM10011610_47980 [Nocardia rhizosphaerihabitans]|uniref:Uncharacterized protein n=1 Tax=Nocardia rhizosphaerihabitans TaxID=1691570 RepID=A0ABQ2KPQ6_9NOCA|nr:hypothetical protein GCM10011610_47980 [Nocardia rhizosphaerihabitans]